MPGERVGRKTLTTYCQSSVEAASHSVHYNSPGQETQTGTQLPTLHSLHCLNKMLNLASEYTCQILPSQGPLTGHLHILRHDYLQPQTIKQVGMFN